MNEWMIYALLKLDAIQAFFGVAGMASLVITVLWSIFAFQWGFDHKESDLKIRKDFSRHLKVFIIPILILSNLGFVLIPSTKEAFIIWAAPKIYNSQEKALTKAAALPEKLVDLINSKVDEWTEEAPTNGSAAPEAGSR